jgi:hypothetical protein
VKPLLRVVLLAHFLAGSLAGAGAAQVHPVRLGTRPGAAHRSHSTVRLPDGRFAALWTQGRTAFLQYVDSHGTVAFGPPGRAVATHVAAHAATSTLLDGEAVVVAHARDGVLVAVRRGIDRDNSRILVQWLDGHGNPRWGAGTYAAPVAGREEQIEPFLLASSDGGGFVCFVRANPNTSARRTFYCQRFSPEGQRLWGTGGAGGRGGLPPVSAEEPMAVAAGDGGLLVFWREWSSVPDEEKVFLRGQRLGPDGVRRWGDDGTTVYRYSFPCDISCSITSPSISAVPDGTGGAILAFDDRMGRLPEGVDLNHVTAQRVSAAGEKLWGEGVPVLPSRPPQTLYALWPHPDGGAVVVIGTYPFAFDGGIHLVLQRLATDGRPLWPTEGVTVVDPTSSPDNVYEGPAYGSFDDGVLRIAWERSGTGFSRRYEVRFSAFDAAGNRLTPSDGVPLVSPKPSDDISLLRGFAFDPASGSSFVVWKGERGVAAVLYTP